jgi:mitogen-activated protein kinase 1/3
MYIEPNTNNNNEKYQLRTIPCKEYNYNQEIFYLPIRYKPGDLIGSGAYGAVINAFDNKTNTNIAIKKLKSITDAVDLKRVLREVMIMKYCQHENIITLYDVIFHINKNRQLKKIGDIYLVMEKMDSDLQKIIFSKQELSDDHYQFILYQILRAIYYLHSANIIHRDFKPSNVLINEDCTIKLCDFGMSRNLKENDLTLTEYVVTRYYRAPEIMLSSHHYSKKIDVWSVGCSFAELLTKKFLFPGENYIAQIKLIIEALGSPSEEDLNFISNESAKKYVRDLGKIKKKPIEKIVNYPYPLALDLLDKMLVFNPEKRISIEDALNHPYLKNIREGIEDPVYKGTLNLDFDYDNNITVESLVNLLIKEVNDFESGFIQ